MKFQEKIDHLAAEIGLDRGSLIKQLIRKGYADFQFERAIKEYQSGTISLSRAAEIAGMSIRDLLSKMPEVSFEINYDVPELKRDLEGSG